MRFSFLLSYQCERNLSVQVRTYFDGQYQEDNNVYLKDQVIYILKSKLHFTIHLVQHILTRFNISTQIITCLSYVNLIQYLYQYVQYLRQLYKLNNRYAHCVYTQLKQRRLVDTSSRVASIDSLKGVGNFIFILVNLDDSCCIKDDKISWSFSQVISSLVEIMNDRLCFLFFWGQNKGKIHLIRFVLALFLQCYRFYGYVGFFFFLFIYSWCDLLLTQLSI
eukprot:TRINITY_DN4258_c0_g1_i14.p2 TRINITY_DN4258_c0_g1~~TRINITY_DN4258_c0_g1_i14.p2  ORF type:complete len:221 (+),score=-12.33 TRINITY_DN4258_c0_g1_i14:514-1176(+)